MNHIDPPATTEADPADVELRSALQALAPPGDTRSDDEDLLQRGWRRLSEEIPEVSSTSTESAAGSPELPRHPAAPPTPAAHARHTRPGSRRHRWRVGALAAAAVAAAVLLGVGAYGMFAPGPVDSAASDSSAAIAAQEPGVTMAEPNPGAAEPGMDGGAAATPVTPADARTTAAPEAAATAAIASDASMVVASDDVAAARDSFVTDINALGGRVTAETVTGSGLNTPAMPEPAIGTDSAVSSSTAIYPPWPSIPGVSLSVEVPAAQFDEALAAARGLGEVVSYTRSSVDVGATVTDTEARIAALEASLARLRGLLERATSLSDVIELENAIASRQAELDGLLAMQRDLANQTEQSRITLQLVTPQVADEYFTTSTPGAWERILDIAGTVWLWLGVALVVTSPLWLLGAGLWWWSRRRRRGA
jgi:hypothetical protein